MRILFTPFLAFENFLVTPEIDSELGDWISVFPKNFLKGSPLHSFFLFRLVAYDVVCLRLRELTGLVEAYYKGRFY